MSYTRNDRKRASRRGYAIHAYVGQNGGGKSLAAVWDTLPSLEAGRNVLSTVRLLDYQNPRECPGGRACDDPANHGGTADTAGVHGAAHPLYVPFREYGQLLDFRGGDVLMDEVTGVASSRESQAMPVQVANYLVQLRRRDVMLRWSTPNWARADKIIREVTQAVTHCCGYAPVTRHTENGTRLWRDRRVFVWRTYDAMAFDDFTEGKREGLKARPFDIHRRIGSPAMYAYDTLDSVIALGWANEAGLCMSCGGKRAHPKCTCDTHSGTDRARPGSLVDVVRATPPAGDGENVDPEVAALAASRARLPRSARRAARDLAGSEGPSLTGNVRTLAPAPQSE